MWILALWLTCLRFANGAPTAAAITFAASSDSSLPLAEIRGDEMTSGILMEIGNAIAFKLHRSARYVTVPRNRLDIVFTEGSVDGICYVLPGWVNAAVNWSKPFISNENLLVGGTRNDAPNSLQNLSGERVGMVLGYKYPELDAMLGSRYIRDDAPTMPLNIKKLAAGRFRYAIVDRLSLEYHTKLVQGLNTLSTTPISTFFAGCVFSKASQIPFSSINQAIDELVKEGSVERIIARYH